MANMTMRREKERTKKRMKNKESFERRKGSSIEHTNIITKIWKKLE
jgi:hypothetical protein